MNKDSQGAMGSHGAREDRVTLSQSREQSGHRKKHCAVYFLMFLRVNVVFKFFPFGVFQCHLS